MLADVLPRARELDPTLDEAKLAVAMLRLDAIWDQLFPAEQRRIVKLMVEKVIITLFDLAVGPPAFREGQRERLRSVPANPPKTPTTVDQTC